MIDQRIEQALRSSEAVQELRKLALHLFAEGQTRQAILEVFEHTRQQLRQANREADEDAVMDVMDCLVGWCSPGMELPPEQPTATSRD
jgi:flagellin-specific chaperone FliS